MKISNRTSAIAAFALSISLIVVFQAVRNLEPVGELSTQSAAVPNKQKWGKIGALPNEWFYAQRAYPLNQVDPEMRLQAAQEYRGKRAAAREASAAGVEALLNWQLAGPTNVPGRVTDLAVHPSDSATMYVASAGAGLFKTTDLGRLITAVPVAVVIVCVIIVTWAADFAGDWVVAVPVIGMTTVPVIAGIPITERPVAAQADEHIFTMVIRIHITERKPWPAIVMHCEAILRPDGPAPDPVMVVSVNVVMMIRISDQVRPVVIDHARRPEHIITVQTCFVSTNVGYSCFVDYSLPLRRRGYSRRS